MSNSTNSKLSKDTLRAGIHGVKTSYVYSYANTDVIYVQNSMDVENQSGDTVMTLHTNNSNNTSIQFMSGNVFKGSVQYNNTSNQLEICGVGSTKKIGIDSSAFYPLTTSAYSFGKTGNRWSTIYTDGLNITGSIILGDSSTFVPTTTNTVDLGSATYTFKRIYGDLIGSASLNLLKTGGTMSGALNMGNQNISNVNNLTAAGTITFSGITQAGFLAVDVNGVVSSTAASSGSESTSPTYLGLTLTNLNSTGIVHTNSNGVFSTSAIVNDDISSSAAIADTKLATISTTGKVLNSATTATSANTYSTIVARDTSGNFIAGTITASLTGAASLNLLLTGGTLSGGLNMGNNTITGVSGLTFYNYNTAGVIHNNSSGVVSSSLIINADITDSTITNAKLAAIASDSTASAIVVRDSNSAFSASGITFKESSTTRSSISTGSGITTVTLSSSDMKFVVGSNNLLVTDSTITRCSLSQNGVKCFDNVSLMLGDSTDWWMYHDGTTTNYMVSGLGRNIDFQSEGASSVKTTVFRLDGTNNYLSMLGNRLSFGASNQMLQYHDGSNGYITLSTGSLNIKSSNNSALGTVLNPAAYNSVIQFEDMLDTANFNPSLRTGGALGGSAAIYGGYVRLTPNTANQHGQLLYRGHPGNSFTAEFEFKIGEVTKADGVWFYFNNSSAPDNMELSTSGLGGYMIGINEYNNDTNTNDLLSLYYNGTLLLSAELPVSNSVLSLVNNTWIRMKIIFCMNQFWVTLNEYHVGGFYPYIDTRRSLSESNNYYGLAAHCGAVFTTHDVRNFRIAKSNGGPINATNDVSVIKPGGKMAVQSLANEELFTVSSVGDINFLGDLYIKSIRKIPTIYAVLTRSSKTYNTANYPSSYTEWTDWSGSSNSSSYISISNGRITVTMPGTYILTVSFSGFSGAGDRDVSFSIYNNTNAVVGGECKTRMVSPNTYNGSLAPPSGSTSVTTVSEITSGSYFVLRWKMNVTTDWDLYNMTFCIYGA